MDHVREACYTCVGVQYTWCDVEVDVGVEFLPGGQLVSLTGPTLVAEASLAAVTGPGGLCVENCPALKTPSQPQVLGQLHPAGLHQLATVKCLLLVAASQVKSQLPHSEETLTAAWAGLAPEHLLAVEAGLVSLQSSGVLGNPVTQITRQGRLAYSYRRLMAVMVDCHRTSGSRVQLGILLNRSSVMKSD